jgi:hypothetical protein
MSKYSQLRLYYARLGDVYVTVSFFNTWIFVVSQTYFKTAGPILLSNTLNFSWLPIHTRVYYYEHYAPESPWQR